MKTEIEERSVAPGAVVKAEHADGVLTTLSSSTNEPKSKNDDCGATKPETDDDDAEEEEDKEETKNKEEEDDDDDDDDGTGSDDSDSDSDSSGSSTPKEEDGISEYERLRLQRIKRNQDRLAALGLTSGSLTALKQQRRRRKRKREFGESGEVNGKYIEPRSQPKRTAKLTNRENLYTTTFGAYIDGYGNRHNDPDKDRRRKLRLSLGTLGSSSSSAPSQAALRKQQHSHQKALREEIKKRKHMYSKRYRCGECRGCTRTYDCETCLWCAARQRIEESGKTGITLRRCIFRACDRRLVDVPVPIPQLTTTQVAVQGVLKGMVTTVCQRLAVHDVVHGLVATLCAREEENGARTTVEHDRVETVGRRGDDDDDDAVLPGTRAVTTTTIGNTNTDTMKEMEKKGSCTVSDNTTTNNSSITIGNETNVVAENTIPSAGSVAVTVTETIPTIKEDSSLALKVDVDGTSIADGACADNDTTKSCPGTFTSMTTNGHTENSNNSMKIHTHDQVEIDEKGTSTVVMPPTTTPLPPTKTTTKTNTTIAAAVADAEADDITAAVQKQEDSEDKGTGTTATTGTAYADSDDIGDNDGGIDDDDNKVGEKKEKEEGMVVVEEESKMSLTNFIEFVNNSTTNQPIIHKLVRSDMLNVPTKSNDGQRYIKLDQLRKDLIAKATEFPHLIPTPTQLKLVLKPKPPPTIVTAASVTTEEKTNGTIAPIPENMNMHMLDQNEGQDQKQNQDETDAEEFIEEVERPKRSRNPYIVFCDEMRSSVRKEFPSEPIGIISKRMGQRWKEITDEKEKEKYYLIASKEKEIYQQKLDAFFEYQEKKRQRQQKYDEQESAYLTTKTSDDVLQVNDDSNNYKYTSTVRLSEEEIIASLPETLLPDKMDEFQEFLLTIPHGPTNKCLGSRSTEHIITTVRKLLSGQGIVYYLWPDGINFKRGTKVHLGMDLDKLLHEAVEVENMYEDHRKGTLLRHPITKMIYYKEWIMRGKPNRKAPPIPVEDNDDGDDDDMKGEHIDDKEMKQEQRKQTHITMTIWELIKPYRVKWGLVPKKTKAAGTTSTAGIGSKENDDKNDGSDIDNDCTELKQKCLKILDGLQSHEHGYIFNEPVDPVELKLDSYFEIIETPMDLGTVKKKLENDEYHAIDDFQSDTKLTFDNAMEYNEEDSEVYDMANELNTKFKVEVDELKQQLKTENIPHEFHFKTILREEVQQKRQWATNIDADVAAELAWPVLPQNDVSKILGSLLDEVLRYDEENAGGVFSTPVPRDDFPEYYEQIDTPMDYGTMKNKLENGDYPSGQEMQKDFNLVMKNCFQFNAHESDICQEVRTQLHMRTIQLNKAAIHNDIFLAEDGSVLHIVDEEKDEMNDGKIIEKNDTEKIAETNDDEKTGETINNDEKISEKNDEEKIGDDDNKIVAKNNMPSCRVCSSGGDLIFCDTCKHYYHSNCHWPKIKEIPTGDWSCRECELKKKKVKPIFKHRNSTSTCIPVSSITSINAPIALQNVFKTPIQKRGKLIHQCPFCSRIFTVKHGLKYHMDNNVCGFRQMRNAAKLANMNGHKQAMGKATETSIAAAGTASFSTTITAPASFTALASTAAAATAAALTTFKLHKDVTGNHTKTTAAASASISTAPSRMVHEDNKDKSTTAAVAASAATTCQRCGKQFKTFQGRNAHLQFCINVISKTDSSKSKNPLRIKISAKKARTSLLPLLKGGSVENAPKPRKPDAEAEGNPAQGTKRSKTELKKTSATTLKKENSGRKRKFDVDADGNPAQSAKRSKTEHKKKVNSAEIAAQSLLMMSTSTSGKKKGRSRQRKSDVQADGILEQCVKRSKIEHTETVNENEVSPTESKGEVDDEPTVFKFKLSTIKSAYMDPDSVKIRKWINSAARKPNDHKAQDKACERLRKYLTSIDDAKKVVLFGGVEVICKAIQNHSNKSIVVAEASCTLADLTWIYPGISSKLVHMGAIELIIDAMNNSPSDPNKVLQMGCAAFRALSYTNNHIKKIIDSGALRVVLISMERNPNKFGLQNQGCNFLQNIVTHSDANTAKQISNSQVVPILLDAVTRDSSDTEFQQSIFGLIANLALVRDSKESLILSGTIPVIIGILDTSSDADIKQAAFISLRHLAMGSTSNQVKIWKEGGLSSAFDAIESYPNNPDLLLSSLNLIKELCVSDGNIAQDVNKMDGIKVLLKVMDYNSDFGIIQIAACNVVGLLVAVLEGRDSVKFVPKLARAIIAAMKNHSDVPELQIQACDALYELSQMSAARGVLTERTTQELLRKVKRQSKPRQSDIDSIFATCKQYLPT